MSTYISRSEADTIAIAEKLAKTLVPGDVVALFGGLGRGKTAFVRGLAYGLGLDGGQVCSPTFALVNEYRGAGARTLCHFDMYRVTGEEALHTTGFYDCIDNGGILAVEWSENILYALPERAINVTISLGEDETQRVIVVQGKESV